MQRAVGEGAEEQAAGERLVFSVCKAGDELECRAEGVGERRGLMAGQRPHIIDRALRAGGLAARRAEKGQIVRAEQNQRGLIAEICVDGGQELRELWSALRHALRHARLAGVFCQSLFGAYICAQYGFRRKAAEFQDRKLRNFVARGAFASRFEGKDIKCLQRLRRGLPRERLGVGRRVFRLRGRGGRVRRLGPDMAELLFYAFKPFLCPQRSLERCLLLCGLLQNSGAQILQQIAGGAAAGEPAVPAKARQEKFVGIIDEARLFPQQRRRRRKCPSP